MQRFDGTSKEGDENKKMNEDDENRQGEDINEVCDKYEDELRIGL